jgi:thymidine kinase
MSELHLILGPMFAGKTTLLINKANEIKNNSNTILHKDEILIINHSSDIRYSENTFITSHDNIRIPCVAMSSLCSIFENDISKIKYIFINEGQFFSDLFDTIKELIFKYKIKIYICGLDGDYKQDPFTQCKLLDLIPFSSTIIKLTANCTYCKNKAPFTKRIINSSDIFLVGGAETYQPVCIEHLH